MDYITGVSTPGVGAVCQRDGILETTIRTQDMVPARAFYEGALGLELIDSDNGCRRGRVAANVKMSNGSDS